MILGIKTDKPEAELYLLDDAGVVKARYSWLADRQLAATLHSSLAEFLEKNNTKFENLSGITVFRGPGSFTGLRIGITVANTLAYSLNIPVVGVAGQNGLKESATALKNTKTGEYITPEYGVSPTITKPAK